jgi:hypothetical protein
MNTSSRSHTDSADTAYSVSHAVVQRIATATDKNAADLPPLYETIDPDALNELGKSVEADRTPLTITFIYVGQQVTVTGNGIVQLDGSECQ